jgi:phosphoglycerol transferase MdoB-like AlkP superfamily enzyme
MSTNFNKIFFQNKILIFTASTIFFAFFYYAAVEASNYKFHAAFMPFGQKISFWAWFIPEYLFFYCLGILFCRKEIFWRSVFYVASAMFFLIYLAQAASTYMTGDLISPLALENIKCIGLIAKTISFKLSLILGVLGGIFFIFVMEFFGRKRFKISRKTQIYLISFIGIMFVYLLFYNFASFNIKLKNSEFFLSRQTPVYSIISNTIEIQSQQPTLSPLDAIAFEKFNFNYNKNSTYPFEKSTIFSKPLKYSSTKAMQKPNIIVFFIEGLAARSINCYGCKFKGLTPNIDCFAQQTMQVFNYYNHTAATYRGIQGQLCSIYPLKGGAMWNSGNSYKIKKTAYSSVPWIMNQKGYDSIFFYSQDDSLTSLFKMLDFQQVYNSQRIISELLKGREKLVKPKIITDESLFDGLICYLKKREKSKSKKSFFLGLYNMQTHVYFKIPEGGIRYKNTRNDVLDTVHNLDAQFGKFHKYFMSSSYAKNTIVIFTADHTHYHGDASYRKTVSCDYQAHFVGKIPLLIYNPFMALPKNYDAKMATSIDFAPTLLHMLGINNIPNNFMGESIFERTRDYGFSAIGYRFFFIHKNRIYTSPPQNSMFSDIFATAKQYIKTFYAMEAKNKIFSGEFTCPTPKALKLVNKDRK